MNWFNTAAAAVLVAAALPLAAHADDDGYGKYAYELDKYEAERAEKLYKIESEYDHKIDKLIAERRHKLREIKDEYAYKIRKLKREYRYDD